MDDYKRVASPEQALINETRVALEQFFREELPLHIPEAPPSAFSVVTYKKDPKDQEGHGIEVHMVTAQGVKEAILKVIPFNPPDVNLVNPKTDGTRWADTIWPGPLGGEFIARVIMEIKGAIHQYGISEPPEPSIEIPADADLQAWLKKELG